MLGGMLFSAVRTLLALAGVCALAWVVLAALARRGIGLGRAAGAARLQVVERLSLSPRRQLYLIRADERLLLVGSGEAGALTLIAELDGSRNLPPLAAQAAQAAQVVATGAQPGKRGAHEEP